LEELRQEPGKSMPSALPPFGDDGLVEPLPQVIGQLVQLVAAIDLARLPRGTQRDLAMFAAAEVLLEIGPERNGRVLIEPAALRNASFDTGDDPRSSARGGRSHGCC
jgi:hypothetical protein